MHMKITNVHEDVVHMNVYNVIYLIYIHNLNIQFLESTYCIVFNIYLKYLMFLIMFSCMFAYDICPQTP